VTEDAKSSAAGIPLDECLRSTDEDLDADDLGLVVAELVELAQRRCGPRQAAHATLCAFLSAEHLLLRSAGDSAAVDAILSHLSFVAEQFRVRLTGAPMADSVARLFSLDGSGPPAPAQDVLPFFVLPPGDTGEFLAFLGAVLDKSDGSLVTTLSTEHHPHAAALYDWVWDRYPEDVWHQALGPPHKKWSAPRRFCWLTSVGALWVSQDSIIIMASTAPGSSAKLTSADCLRSFAHYFDRAIELLPAYDADESFLAFVDQLLATDATTPSTDNDAR